MRIKCLIADLQVGDLILACEEIPDYQIFDLPSGDFPCLVLSYWNPSLSTEKQRYFSLLCADGWKRSLGGVSLTDEVVILR